MVEQEEETSVKRKAEQGTTCEECKTNSSKYKCPACSLRSCGLPCVKAHKERTGCTGKRQLNVVPISQFDDNLLLSDYNMLEDVKRVAESAKRMRMKLCGYPHFRLPFQLKSLQRAAASRRTKLLFVPSGMSRRESNRSYYNNRKKFICWTVEWHFHSTDVKLIDHGVHENTKIKTMIEKHLKPGPWTHRLKQFCDVPLDSIKFFIRKYPKGPKSPFRKLDLMVPVREQLTNLVVLEYPVIHVFLPSASYNFEVINDVPLKEEHKESLNSSLVQEGVTFKEEEIDDQSLLGPQVLDLTKHVKVDLASHHKNKRIKKELNDTVDKPSLMGCQGSKPVSQKDFFILKAEGDNTVGSEAKDLGLIEDLDFDFDQGLIDAYSDIIAQTNPDDFLDFESLLSEGVGPDENRRNMDFNEGFSVDDELEEGEIPEF